MWAEITKSANHLHIKKKTQGVLSQRPAWSSKKLTTVFRGWTDNMGAKTVALCSLRRDGRQMLNGVRVRWRRGRAVWGCFDESRLINRRLTSAASSLNVSARRSSCWKESKGLSSERVAFAAFWLAALDSSVVHPYKSSLLIFFTGQTWVETAARLVCLSNIPTFV